MIPIRPNSNKENCSSISSNCVIWQGPDIPCINLCKGDTVSDVVYKLADELCTLKTSLSITDLELTCLLELCQTTPEPELTLAAVLQLVINKVCCSYTEITSNITDNYLRVGDAYTEPTLVLPTCLQYVSPSTGLTVTSLPLSEYAIVTANAICNLTTTVNNHTTQISNHEIRITTLENEPGYTPPTVTPHCTYGDVTSGIPAEMDVLLSSLDEKVCDLVTTLGSNTELNAATTSQCPLLGSQNALSQLGTMSSLPGWNNTISNLAESLQNLWITVCDMRSAIYDVQQCCGEADCSQFILGYTAIENEARTEITVTLNPFTVIPSGFSNCPLLSTFSITDGVGHTYTDTFDLVAEASNPSGIMFDISTAGLNTTQNFVITITGCITKDGVVCSKQINYTLNAPSVVSCVAWTPTISAEDLAKASGNTNPANDDAVFVSYFDCSTSTLTNVSYTTAGTKSAICVLTGYTPSIYYYSSDLVSPATASSIVSTGTCTTTTTLPL